MDGQADRQIDRPTNLETEGQTDRNINRLTYGWADRCNDTDEEPNRQID